MNINICSSLFLPYNHLPFPAPPPSVMPTSYLSQAEEIEIKLPTFVGSWRKQGNSRKASTSASLLSRTLDCKRHKKLWKILKEMEVTGYFTCLLRNLYSGQEATVRTWHGIAVWFKTGKGVWQGCILSPCLFNLYAEWKSESVSHSATSSSLWPQQAPLPMEFSRQEYWSVLPFPSPGDCPDPGIEPGSPTIEGIFFNIWATREALVHHVKCKPGWFRRWNQDSWEKYQ